jgi:multisubunit Na+/H+ antiporter MnhF subunit
MKIELLYVIFFVCIFASHPDGQTDNAIEEIESDNTDTSIPSAPTQIVEIKNQALVERISGLHPAIYPIILGPSFCVTIMPLSNEAKTAILSCACLAAVLISGLDRKKSFAPQVWKGSKKLASKTLEVLPDMLYGMFQFLSHTIRFIAKPLLGLSLIGFLAIYCNAVGLIAPYDLVMKILACSPYKFTYSIVKEITSVEE